MGLSLAEAVAKSERLHTPPMGQWICPAGVGFTTKVGRDSCFAHALLQMLLGVPQLVAFLATFEGQAEGLGHLVSRCLGHLWSKEQDADGPALVELLRRRATGQFGQNEIYGNTGAHAGGRYFGQQDPSELWETIFDDITERGALEVGSAEHGAVPVDQLHPFAALLVTQSVNVRTCKSCGAEQRRLETATAWRLPIQEAPVTTLAAFLDPMLSDFSSDGGQFQGCKARGCTGGAVQGRLYPVVLPPVLRVEIPRATYDVRKGYGVRSMHKVDLPLRFSTTTAQYGSPNVYYYLRMVLFSIGGESSEAGHYISGRLRGRILEVCSQLPGGVKITEHQCTDNDYLVLEDLSPRLPKGSIAVGAWYSEQLEGEVRIPADEVFNRHLHKPSDGIPGIKEADRPSWYYAGLASGSSHPVFQKEVWITTEMSLTVPLRESRCARDSTTARTAEGPRRPLREKVPTSFEEIITTLELLVPREACLSTPWEAGSKEAHWGLVAEALVAAETSYTPCLTWLPSVEARSLGFENELQQPDAMLLHRQSTLTSGRGGRMSLTQALTYTRKQRGTPDPLVSVNATTRGVYSFPGARGYLEELATWAGQEVTGGAGILVSGCGAETKFHLHGMPVLVHVLAAAHQDLTREPQTVFTHPDKDGPFPVHKRYILFDTETLERAGIRCYDVAEVQSLLSIVLRIKALGTEERKGIRWFDGTLDGTTYNAMYFPTAMLHHVTTFAGKGSTDKALFIGLASETLPISAEARECILRRLRQPAPMDPQGASISELRHIKHQSSSVFTSTLLSDLVAGRIQSVADAPSWFEAEDLRRLTDLRTQAHRHIQLGEWEQAELLLISCETELVSLRHNEEGVAGVQRERQAVSDLLVATGADRASKELAARAMIASVGYHAGKT